MLLSLKKKRHKDNVIKWNFIFYIITFFYTILVGVILVPLYLQYIPRNMYGYWLATGNIVSLLTIIDPGFSAVVQQKIALSYGKKDIKLIGQYSLYGIVISFLFAFVIFISGLIFYSFLGNIFPELTNMESLVDLKKAFLFSLTGTVLMLVYYVIGAIDYGLLSSKGIGIINTIGNFSSLILSVFFLKMGYGVIALGMATFARGVIYLLLSLIYTIARFQAEGIHLNYNKMILKDFTSLMGFNFLGKIGINITTQLNSFVCTRFINPFATPTLKFTQTIPEFSKVLVIRMANSSTPTIANLLGENKITEIRLIVSNILFPGIWLLGLIVTGFYLFNGSFISLWVGETYFGGNILNLLVIVLLVLTIITELFSQIIFALGNIKKNSLILFFQGLIYIPLVIIGAQQYGISGILMAGIICQLILPAWYFPLVYVQFMQIKNQYLIQLFKEIGKILFIILGIIILFLKFDMNIANSWSELLVRALSCVVVYIVALFFSSKRFKSIVLLIKRK
jgi:O-antigen/teichoic acid export membrane protein